MNNRSMYDQVIVVISEHPELRYYHLIEALLPWFRKKSQLFRTLSQDVMVEILKNCQLATKPPDAVVIKQGEQGDCFYILLRGAVSVYINNTLADEEDVQKLAETQIDFTFKDNGELDRTKFGNFILKMGAGETFGELALINENCVRNASIISDETVDLLMVNRELFNKTIKESQQRDLKERSDFVQQHPLFRNWAKKHQRQMAYSLSRVTIQFGEKIVKQGDKCTCLYFLTKGQAKILVDPTAHEHQFSQYYPLEDPDDIIAKEELLGSSDGLVLSKARKESYSSLLPENQLTLSPSSRRKRNKYRKQYEISVIAPQEILGDTEFLLELKCYFATVQCATDCHLFALSSKNYERLVSKRNPWTITLLRDIAQIKLTVRLARWMDNQIPLMKTVLFLLERIDKTKHRGEAALKEIKQHVTHVAARFGHTTHTTRFSQPTKMWGGRSAGIVPPTLLSGQIIALKDPGDSVMSSWPATAKPAKKIPRASSYGLDYGDMTNVNEIALRLHETYGNFKDWESSDKVLSFLEMRIRSWHADVIEYKNERPTYGRSPQLAPFKLRRVTLEKGQEVRPSQRVKIRRNRPITELVSSPIKAEGVPHVHTVEDSPNNTPQLTVLPASEKTAAKEREKIRFWLGEDVLMHRALANVLRPRDSPPSPGFGTIIDVMRRRQEVLLNKVSVLPLSPFGSKSSTNLSFLKSVRSKHSLEPLPEDENMTKSLENFPQVPVIDRSTQRRSSILSLLSNDISYSSFM